MGRDSCGDFNDRQADSQNPGDSTENNTPLPITGSREKSKLSHFKPSELNQHYTQTLQGLNIASGHKNVINLNFERKAVKKAQ